jgi:hypothetical protein
MTVGGYGQVIHEMREMGIAKFGPYDQGNQPVLDMLYLFAALGQPWQTECWTRRVCVEPFSEGNAGIPGDEDDGSMSSWYVLSSIGLYPLCPVTPTYMVTVHCFPCAVSLSKKWLAHQRQLPIVLSAKPSSARTRRRSPHALGWSRGHRRQARHRLAGRSGGVWLSVTLGGIAWRVEPGRGQTSGGRWSRLDLECGAGPMEGGGGNVRLLSCQRTPVASGPGVPPG